MFHQLKQYTKTYWHFLSVEQQPIITNCPISSFRVKPLRKIQLAYCETNNTRIYEIYEFIALDLWYTVASFSEF